MTDVTVHVLRQIDVAESIDLPALRRLAEAGGLPMGAALGPSEPAPPGVVPAHPPVDLTLADVTVGSFVLRGRLRVFDFGVVALRFTQSLTGLSNDELIGLGSDLAGESAAFDAEARRIWD